MAIYAIGDLQGCYREFRQLLDQLRFDPATDRLWLTGDLVNRGPDSLAVLRFVRSLGEAAVTVLGNHDLHLLATACASGRRAPRRGDTLDETLAAADAPELLDWLRHQPLLHHDARLGRTLIHAGLPPQWDLALARRCAAEVEVALRQDAAALFADMYGDQPDRWSDGLQGAERLRFIVNSLTRLRFCTADGRLLPRLKGPLQSAPPEALPWFRVPGRRTAGNAIVCGHWSALGFHDGDGVLAIDTGCVWGGTLCAVRLDAPAGVVQIPCQGTLHPGED
jgi:bis(5'-nucleosyl)-tetraphosphatase (symmetrical)